MNDGSRDEPAPGALSNAEVTAIHGRYGHLLLRRCRRLMGNHAAADDVMQDAFLRVMRQGAAYRRADSELGWLYRVVRNCCFDARKRRQRNAARLDERHGAPIADPPRTLARIAARRALARLPPRERQLVVLALIDGTSQQQIARQIGWSRQTVNRKLGEVRHRLARWLDGRGPTPSARRETA
jgi:RNA polymerase sigma-70 factor, ECF subfamily